MEVPEGAVLVNLGDLLEAASGGVWRSTSHRVPIPAMGARRAQSRVSLVLFQILAADAEVGTAERVHVHVADENVDCGVQCFITQDRPASP